MRMSLLFAVLIGLFPAVIFAATLWLTDGAPLRPVGAGAAPAAASSPAVPAPGETVPAELPRDGGDRLRRLARDGDPEAAILLTILEESQAAEARPAR